MATITQHCKTGDTPISLLFWVQLVDNKESAAVPSFNCIEKL